MARKASTPEQLQQLLAVLRTNYLHHRRAAPSVTYSSHLSCALLEVGVGAAGSGTCHDVRPAVVYTLGTAAVLLGVNVCNRPPSKNKEHSRLQHCTTMWTELLYCPMSRQHYSCICATLWWEQRIHASKA